jgi:hypothetical protein
MLWLKRNLFFVMGLAVAVLLLGYAVFRLYSKTSEDTDITTQLNEQTSYLKEIYGLPVFPSPENIGAVEGDQRRLRGFIERSRAYFTNVAPASVHSAQSFKTELDKLVYRLNNSARTAGVIVPTNGFAYSFEALMSRIDFASSSIRPLAVQMSEVEVLMGILYNAKINRLEAVQRARMAVEDFAPTAAVGSYTDPISPATNAVSVLMPYRLTFRCFSSELASVMEGFVKSPHGLIIKAMDIDQVGDGFSFNPMMPPSPGFTPPPDGNPGGGRPPGFPVRRGVRNMPGGAPAGGFANPRTPQPFAATLAAGGSAGLPGNKTGLQTLLNEKPFRVVMLVQIVSFRR